MTEDRRRARAGRLAPSGGGALRGGAGVSPTDDPAAAWRPGAPSARHLYPRPSRSRRCPASERPDVPRPALAVRPGGSGSRSSRRARRRRGRGGRPPGAARSPCRTAAPTRLAFRRDRPVSTPVRRRARGARPVLDGGLRRRPVPAVPRRDERRRDLRRRALPPRHRQGRGPRRRPAPGTLVVDFNFAYQPSCAFDPRWACPLAPPENRLDVPVRGRRAARLTTARPPGRPPADLAAQGDRAGRAVDPDRQPGERHVGRSGHWLGMVAGIERGAVAGTDEQYPEPRS